MVEGTKSPQTNPSKSPRILPHNPTQPNHHPWPPAASSAKSRVVSCYTGTTRHLPEEAAAAGGMDGCLGLEWKISGKMGTHGDENRWCFVLLLNMFMCFVI